MNTERITKNEHHYFGESCNFFSVSNDECTAAHWGRVWDPSPTKYATISARETNRTKKKKSMSTTAQTYWQSSAETWEGQRNYRYSVKNEVHKNAISCFSIRKDWRFAVHAKSFALLSIATKMVSAPPVPGILQGGQQVSSTIPTYTENGDAEPS